MASSSARCVPPPPRHSHIPENGNAVIVYGPHVGFCNDGIVGKVERKGIKDPNGCCGSAIAAMNSICSEHKTCHLTPTKSRLGRGIMGKKNKSNSPTSVSETQPPLIDIQQYHVCQQIKTTVDMGSADRISLKSLPAVNLTHESLPTAVFDAITPDVDYLLGTSSPQPSLLSKAKTLGTNVTSYAEVPRYSLSTPLTRSLRSRSARPRSRRRRYSHQHS
ncbi:hypothetical protein TL16_g05788 [Triparma laevis f. inornata]|uniref:Limiting CO2-inducible protein B/C beta carbonyic anhydrase domain-containing protein n=1 Tax=Triparma laevis f. inornata TaxID=1714386 RepID=A0A9W7AGP9_9STRA|nr:hypothetical protein TL16_g05788 [Triparma laevis f. inornata]